MEGQKTGVGDGIGGSGEEVREADGRADGFGEEAEGEVEGSGDCFEQWVQVIGLEGGANRHGASGR